MAIIFGIVVYLIVKGIFALMQTRAPRVYTGEDFLRDNVEN